VFTARYALSPYIKQIRFVFKGLSKQLLIRFESQQSFIKHNGYQFMKIIRYENNPNFTKQQQSTPDMEWLLLWGTGGFSRLRQEI
jgi:hypothetical protein